MARSTAFVRSAERLRLALTSAECPSRETILVDPPANGVTTRPRSRSAAKILATRATRARPDGEPIGALVWTRATRRSLSRPVAARRRFSAFTLSLAGSFAL